MRPLRRAVAVAGWATLVAGVVGALRQRREAAAVRAGRLPPARSMTRLAAPREGWLAARVARWAPARPRTRAGRALAFAWASPVTAAGLLLAATSGGRPAWNREHGCLVFEGAHTGSARVLRLVGAGANAIGHVVVSTYDPSPPALLAHEAGHVRQAERLGVLLLPLYVWFAARYGYRQNPVERGAREAARRWWEHTRMVSSDDA